MKKQFANVLICLIVKKGAFSLVDLFDCQKKGVFIGCCKTWPWVSPTTSPGRNCSASPKSPIQAVMSLWKIVI